MPFFTTEHTETTEKENCSFSVEFYRASMPFFTTEHTETTEKEIVPSLLNFTGHDYA